MILFIFYILHLSTQWYVPLAKFYLQFYMFISDLFSISCNGKFEITTDDSCLQQFSHLGDAFETSFFLHGDPTQTTPPNTINQGGECFPNSNHTFSANYRSWNMSYYTNILFSSTYVHLLQYNHNLRIIMTRKQFFRCDERYRKQCRLSGIHSLH